MSGSFKGTLLDIRKDNVNEAAISGEVPLDQTKYLTKYL
jgi:hypothetical protein